MFENILGQPAALRLGSDINAAGLAPSMLFFGPPCSGKGTAALELARVLSCQGEGESRGSWNCSCSACFRHRRLLHPDLLILGPRPFSAEIAAAAATLLREPEIQALRFLFIRSVRKLTVRFSPELWAEDPKLGKIQGILSVLEDELADLDTVLARENPSRETLRPLTGGILKSAGKLESEGMGKLIPVSHIRRAAAWTRLSPLGKRKLLLIENADRMQEEGRNSLLKILEEPPDRAFIVLTTARRDILLPTILSRVRPYRFTARDDAAEIEVIRRVFREKPEGPAGGRIAAYLDSFLPVSPPLLRSLAAFFAASVAAGAVLILRGAPLPEDLAALGRHTAPIAEAAGLGRPAQDLGGALPVVLGGADQFAVRELFSRFLSLLLTLVSETRPGAAFMDLWRRRVREAETAVGIYNQSPALALERLGTELRRGMAEL
jgi:DNA polymerase-3 subunit gamma/tau